MLSITSVAGQCGILSTHQSINVFSKIENRSMMPKLWVVYGLIASDIETAVTQPPRNLDL